MTFRPSLVTDTSDWNSSSVDDEDEPDGIVALVSLIFFFGGDLGQDLPSVPSFKVNTFLG